MSNKVTLPNLNATNELYVYSLLDVADSNAEVQHRVYANQALEKNGHNRWDSVMKVIETACYMDVHWRLSVSEACWSMVCSLYFWEMKRLIPNKSVML